jgi:hypothetical protein
MPTHDIIDNRNVKLIDWIQEALPGSQAAKFAVGYFFLSGLEALANVQELRLLIGNTSSRETIEQIAEGYGRLEQAGQAIEAEAYPQRVVRQQRVSETASAAGATVLERIYYRHNMREATARASAQADSDSLPVIVCSEGLG